MTAGWIVSSKRHLEDLKTPVTPLYKMENKPVDLERWMDFCSVLMCATACSFTVASIQSHIQSHCDPTEHKWQGFGSRGRQMWPVWRRPPAQSDTGVSSPSPIKLQPDRVPSGTPAQILLRKSSSHEGLVMLWMLLETGRGRRSWKDTTEKRLMRRQVRAWLEIQSWKEVTHAGLGTFLRDSGCGQPMSGQECT